MVVEEEPLTLETNIILNVERHDRYADSPAGRTHYLARETKGSDMSSEEANGSDLGR